MEYVALVTVLAVLQFLFFGMAVGRARGKYQVQAPAVTGHEIFERTFRVQQNTLEQLLVLLPSLWLFARYVSPAWGAGLGAVYLVGRMLYFVTYVKDPSKRGPGFALSAVPGIILAVGALIGVIRAF